MATLTASELIDVELPFSMAPLSMLSIFSIPAPIVMKSVTPALHDEGADLLIVSVASQGF